MADDTTNNTGEMALSPLSDEVITVGQAFPELVIDMDYAAFGFFTMVLPELCHVLKGSQWVHSNKLWNAVDGFFAVALGVCQFLDKQSHQRLFNQTSGILNIGSGLQLLAIVGLVAFAVLGHTALAISFTADSVLSSLLSAFSFGKAVNESLSYDRWLADSLAQITHFETIREKLQWEILILEKELTKPDLSSINHYFIGIALDSKQQRLVDHFNLQKTILATVNSHLNDTNTPEYQKDNIKKYLAAVRFESEHPFKKALTKISSLKPVDNEVQNPSGNETTLPVNESQLSLQGILTEFCDASLTKHNANKAQQLTNYQCFKNIHSIDDNTHSSKDSVEESLLSKSTSVETDNANADPLTFEINQSKSALKVTDFDEKSYVANIEAERKNSNWWLRFATGSNALLYGLAAAGMIMAFIPFLQIPAIICIGVACAGFAAKYAAPKVANYCQPPAASSEQSMPAMTNPTPASLDASKTSVEEHSALHFGSFAPSA